MNTTTSTRITVSTRVAKPLDQVWNYWTGAEHVINWNAASDDWCCPHAENDLRIGGKFLCRMEARDGSMGFDFIGTYTQVVAHARIAYTMEDGRTCEVLFAADGNGTRITETFDAEVENTVELQRGGWQAILDKFKAYAEAQG